MLPRPPRPPVRGPRQSHPAHPSSTSAATVVHWGADLSADIDAPSLVAALEAPITHAAADHPMRTPLVPMPVDGWRMRPWLEGARADGTDWSPALEFTTARHPSDGVAEVHFADQRAGLALELALRLDEHGVLTIEQVLHNTADTPYLVGGLLAILPVPGRATEVLDLTGRWCRERAPQRHLLPMGAWVREGRRGRTGHDSPTLVIAGTSGFGFRHGEVWAMHHAWSGNSVYLAERTPTGHTQLAVGERLEVAEVRLEPRASYAAPAAHAAYSGEGLDGLSAAWHSHIRARPTHPRTPRPVILNTWEAVYFAHDQQRLTALADVAAQVGVERFVLDDGWFGGRRNEMVNPDSDLFRAHPDWLLQVPGREPPTWRHQQVLDLAQPDCFDHLLGRLDALLGEYDITYLKWDHNRDLVDPGRDGGRPGVRAQTLAFYRLLDDLRARHPGVEIETCASGGGRIDLGVLARTDRVWASDTIDPLERQHIQRWTGLLLPPEVVGSHIAGGVSHTTGRRHSLAFRAATAIFGHLGIEWDLTQLTAVDRAHLTAAVAAYRSLRPLLHAGVTVRSDELDDSALLHGVVSPTGDEAVYCYVQLASSPTEAPVAVTLPGLRDSTRYAVRLLPVGGNPSTQQVRPPSWTRSGITLDGRSLRTVGLRLPVLHPEQALFLQLTRPPVGPVPAQISAVGSPRPERDQALSSEWRV
jgi:alpha-galactosidase